MVIVLQKNISHDERMRLTDFLARNNFKTNEIAGEEKTIIAAVGKLKIDPREVAVLPGVERVIPISKPYKMASREFKKDDTIVEIKNPRGEIVRIGGKRITAIAGPCAVENREQIMSVAKRVSESGAALLRGGAYKPRSSPYSFQGLGEEGLRLLKEAGNAFGLSVATEVVDAANLSLMEKYGVDIYQVGARNMQNFELLKKLGALNKPVILKRGLSATIEEWLMAAEYLLSSGCDKVILCERGIRTYERATRNTLDLSAIPVLREMTHLPIIVDPSHALGIRDKVPPMALAAVAAGADGIIVEVHCDPDCALSDGAQSLFPEQFDKLMRDIEALAPVVGKAVVHVHDTKKIHECENTHEGIVCAFSGNHGAYAEQAISLYFDEKVNSLAFHSFREIFQAVQDGKADYAMVPIENTLAGSVYENYDNLTQFEDVHIIGDMLLRVEHSLLAKKGASMESIKKVYSHPQAFQQCQRFLNAHSDWKKVECASTATAAEEVAKLSSNENAAIASAITAPLYNLEIVRDAIEDDAANYTRFFVIAKKQKSAIDANAKSASFTFSVKNEPGSLYKTLGVFESFHVNLTRLESRPIQGKPWQYRFYVDANFDKAETNVVQCASNIIDTLSSYASDIRLLGIYAEAKRKI